MGGACVPSHVERVLRGCLCVGVEGVSVALCLVGGSGVYVCMVMVWCVCVGGL